MILLITKFHLHADGSSVWPLLTLDLPDQMKRQAPSEGRPFLDDKRPRNLDNDDDPPDVLPEDEDWDADEEIYHDAMDVQDVDF